MYKCILASEEYVEWIRDVAAKKMLEEELYKPHFYNKNAVEGLIRQGMSTNTMWIVLKNNEPVGALGALVTPVAFNPSIQMIHEIFWWVDSTHRNGRAGLLLLNAFIEEAAKFPESTLSLLSYIS